VAKYKERAIEFSNIVTIDRTVGDVFAFVADFENAPKWNYAIAETRKTSAGPVASGTRYRQVRTLPSRSEEAIEVVEFEPDSRVAVSGDLGPFTGTMTYVFEEEAGRTRLTNTARLGGRGAMRLAAPLAAGRVRDAVAENLRTLKSLLERE